MKKIILIAALWGLLSWAVIRGITSFFAVILLYRLVTLTGTSDTIMIYALGLIIEAIPVVMACCCSAWVAVAKTKKLEPAAGAYREPAG